MLFQVNEQQLKRQLDEITYIIKLRENLNPKAGPVSVFSITWVDRFHLATTLATHQLIFSTNQ